MFAIRHGKTDDNARGIYSGRSCISLNEVGRRETYRVANDEIKYLDIKTIYSSPVWRAKETAEIIRSVTGAPIVIDHRLTEMEMGLFQDKSEEYLRETYEEIYWTWVTTPHLLKLEGRETLQEVHDRAVGFYKEKLWEEGVLVVSHVAPLRCMVLYRMGYPLSNYKKIEIKNATLFKV